MKNIFFVDSENVGDAWLDLFDYVGGDDQILVFYTDKSPNMSYESVIRLKHSDFFPEFVSCKNGTDNALDFQLVTYLGALVEKNPEDTMIIVSRDKGFDSVVHFWTKRGYHVMRKAPSIFYTLSDNAAAEESDERTECSENAENAGDTDSTENVDNAVEADGEPALIEYDEEQVDVLLSCIGKSNLSVLHNILRSIYGQETGGFIYEIVKKPSFDVTKVNWQKKTKYRKFLNILYSNAGLNLGDDFFKKLYPQKANLKTVHNHFVTKYGQQKGTEYYRIYKNHAEFLQKNF